jgi:hypothetical protein
MNIDITRVGKALVVANVGLSLAFLGLALAVYTNHVDWPGSAGPGQATQGELTKKRAELDQAQKAAAVAVARWDAVAPVLTGREARRPKNEQEHAEHLAVAEGVGPSGNPVNAPVQVFEHRKGGALDADGLPILEWHVPRRPLDSRRVALQKINQVEDDITKEIAAATDLIKQEDALTLEINGIPEKQKGIRDLLAEVVRAGQEARVELESLRPQRYNREVQVGLLRKRQQSLQARITELKNQGLAFGRP